MDVKKLPVDVRSEIRSNIIIRDVKSCVFELVENSLDAKASSIAVCVDLKRFRIQVVDNGIGLTKHDLETIGQGYVTRNHGKSRNWEKGTRYFGHRGEALRSISKSCRKLIISSRAANSKKSYCREIEGDSLGKAMKVSCGRVTSGTTVIVENLLYNVPVRRVAIEPSVELDSILHYLQANALISTTVSFILRDDEKNEELLKTTKCESMKESFLKLFPKILKFDDSLIEVYYENDNNNKVKAFGLFSKEMNNNNNLQFVFVNRKICNNKNIFKFVNKLLGKSFYLKGISSNKGKWAIFVIEIKCSKTEYDENIEEFKNWKLITECISEMVDNFVNRDLKANLENPRDDDVLQEIEMLYNDFKQNKNEPKTPPKIEKVYENPMIVYGHKVKRKLTPVQLLKTPENFKNLHLKKFSNENSKKFSQEGMGYFSSNFSLCSSLENSLKIESENSKKFPYKKFQKSEEKNEKNLKIDFNRSEEYGKVENLKGNLKENLRDNSTIDNVLNATRNYCLNINMDFSKGILGKNDRSKEYDVKASKLMLRQHFSNRNNEWKVKKNILKEIKKDKKSLIQQEVRKEGNKRKIKRKRKCYIKLKENSSSDENVAMKRPKWNTVKNNKWKKRKSEESMKKYKNESSTESKEDGEENSKYEFVDKKENFLIEENKIGNQYQRPKNGTEGERNAMEVLSLLKQQDMENVQNNGKHDKVSESNKKAEKIDEKNKETEEKAISCKKLEINKKISGENKKIKEFIKDENVAEKQEEEIELLEKLLKNTTTRKRLLEVIKNELLGDKTGNEEIKNQFGERENIKPMEKNQFSNINNEIEILNKNNENLILNRSNENKILNKNNANEFLNWNNENKYLNKTNEKHFLNKDNENQPRPEFNNPSLRLHCPSDYFTSQSFFPPYKSSPELFKSPKVEPNNETAPCRKVQFCLDNLKNSKVPERSSTPLKGIIRNFHFEKTQREVNSTPDIDMNIFSPVRLECLENFEFRRFEENRNSEKCSSENNQNLNDVWLKSIYDDCYQGRQKNESHIIDKCLPSHPVDPFGKNENKSSNFHFLSCKEDQIDIVESASDSNSSLSCESFSNSSYVDNQNFPTNSPEKIECVPSYQFSFEAASDFSNIQWDERRGEDDPIRENYTQSEKYEEIPAAENEFEAAEEVEEEEKGLWSLGQTPTNENYKEQETEQFIIEERNTFLPKGLSPYLRSNKDKNLSISLTDSQRNILHETVNTYPKGEPSTLRNVIQTIKMSDFTTRSVRDEINELNTSVIFTKEDIGNFEVIANLDNKFILTRVQMKSCNSNLVVVMDQHAVHERIRLERLVEDYTDKNGNLKISSLNPPIGLNINESKAFIMERHKRQFRKVGIHFEICKDRKCNVKVSSVPVCVVNKAQKEVSAAQIYQF